MQILVKNWILLKYRMIQMGMVTSALPMMSFTSYFYLSMWFFFEFVEKNFVPNKIICFRNG